MSRNDTDIPEVFRRAMEEVGWETEEQGSGRDRPPLPPRIGRPWWFNRSFWLIGLALLLLVSLKWISTTYTEWLWFTELNYQYVWLKQWGVRVLIFIIFFAVATAVLLVNWQAARRRALRSALPFQVQPLRLRGINWLITGSAFLLGFVLASIGAGRWEAFLRYYYRVPYGTNDPIFNRDISFYLFELPIYHFLQGWLLALLLLTLLGALTVYTLGDMADIQRGRWQPHRSLPLRQHMALLGALLLGMWALGYWFGIYDLLYSSHEVLYGASYSDMNATLWALRAQLLLMALTALAVAFNIFRLDLRPVLATAGLWLVATLLLGGLYPALLQRYVVEPNEIERERPYITHNIQFTRLAFNLDKIEVRPFDVRDTLNPQALQESEIVLRNIRLWDYRPLQATYEQLQALRPYYQFGEIDIDRYDIEGQTRQVMLAARELNKANLPAPSWVNRNLEFTHGYGIVMNPVDEVTPEGQPQFFIQDLPPRSTIPLEVTRPEIYYGELTNDVVFVGSGREEFDYPSGNENVYSSYEGEGGVPLDNYLERVAFAIRLGDVNVLLSNEIDANTRVQFHRQILERVQNITPFLTLDSDPYIVVWNGRLVWLIDGYTLSRNFPYATPTADGFNYMRNAAKITIDAYDGTVTYYMADPEDPLIQAYARAFPDLFHPLAEMPAELQAHIRYPEELYLAQAQQFLIYHMTDVRVFYNKEDSWHIPAEVFDAEQQLMEPYYVTLPLPEETEPEFLLILPFTPANKPNMIAWLAARNDMPNYGELVVYELPKQELVFGPIQVEGRIDQDPLISQQFALWNQRDTSVIRGNLLVIPLDNSFLYVEPVYLRSSTSALPELRRVILATSSRVVMQPTLDEALAALFLAPDEVPIVVEEDGLNGGDDTTAPPTEVEGAPTDATVGAIILSANQHFEAAEAAQRNGDWATYGRELEALQRDLQRLTELTGATP